MKQFVLLLTITMILATAALGGDFEQIGAGGGGWLHAGAYLPSNDDYVVVGADVSGIYLSTDGGDSWNPHNAGLATQDEIQTNYVSDVEGVSRPGQDAFFATTYGGIFKYSIGGDWVNMTPPAGYYYEHQYDWGTVPMGIPFECIDWDGGDILVAGAGKVRWGDDYETTYYPWPSVVQSSSHPDLDSIWLCDLSSGTPTWAPMPNSDFGAVRDISVFNDNGVITIAAVTAQGVYYWDGSTWHDLSSWQVGINSGSGYPSPGAMPYGTDLEGWSIHLSDRGNIYLACSSNDPGSAFPSGVYKSLSVDLIPSGYWYYSDDLQNDSYYGVSMTQMGRDGSTHPNLTPWVQTIAPGNFVFLTVADQAGPLGEDILYLGSRNNSYGFFKGLSPFASYGLSDTHWENLVANNGPPTGVLAGADDGWAINWSSSMLFHPVVSSSSPGKIIVQFDGRLHKSNDFGATWEMNYTESVGNGWSGSGYNELCVMDLDWFDGDLVQSTGDIGVFRCTDLSGNIFEHINPEADGDYSETGPNEVYSNESNNIEVVENWNGTSLPAMFVSYSDVIQRNRAGKIMQYYDFTGSGPEWRWIGGDLTDPENYIFSDFVVVDDTKVYAIYYLYSGPVGGSSTLVENGVVLFELIQGVWEQSFFDGSIDQSKRFSAISYNTGSDRLFLTAGQPSGGIWYRDLTGGVNDWIQCVGPDDQNVPSGQQDFEDVVCISGSSDGLVMYAGTRGRSDGGGYGTILKCENPSSSMPVWTPQFNDSASNCVLGYASPTHQPWDSWRANKIMTNISTILVSKINSDKYFFGVESEYSGALHTKNGVWYCDGTDFQQIGANENFQGISVNALEQQLTGLLLVGTSGLETWKQKKTLPPLDDNLEDPNGSGFQLRINQRLGERGVYSVSYNLVKPSSVEISVYDLRGRMVNQVSVHHSSVGEKTFQWDGRSSQGRKVSSGVYFVMVKTDDAVGRGKITLIR